MKKLIKRHIIKQFELVVINLMKYKGLKKIIVNSAFSNIPNDNNSRLKNFLAVLKKQGFYPRTVYDIGANRGMWSRNCMSVFPNAVYYLFEPQEKLLPKIHKKLEGYNNYKVFSVGVGDQNKTKDFTIHVREDSCSYLYTPEEAMDRGFDQITIPMIRLDDFVKKNELEMPSIIKIDAEGLDFEVLKGAGELLLHAEVVLVEVAIMNQRLPNTALKILETMESNGYRLFDITDLNRPFPNGVLWLCEFAFIKKNGILDKNYANL